jgi:hypothetical protein
MPADIAGGSGSEHRVGHRVTDRVRIGVAEQAALERDGDTTQHERAALHEAMQIVAGANAKSGGSSGGALHGASCNRLGDDQIVWRRDLDVCGLAFDQSDRVTGAFRERGLVGRFRTGLPQSERLAKHFAPERLRRLREIDRVAGERLGDNQHSSAFDRLPAGLTGAPGGKRAPLHGVARGHRSQRGTVLRSGGNRARDQIRARKGTGRVVNHDQIALLVRGLEGLAHRILTPEPAGNEADRLRRGAQVGRRIGHQFGRECDDEFVDRRVAEKGSNGPLENGTAADADELLGHSAAEPLAVSASRDDCCDLHGIGQTRIIAGAPPAPVFR